MKSYCHTILAITTTRVLVIWGMDRREEIVIGGASGGDLVSWKAKGE